MNRRIIINIDDQIADARAVELVRQIIAGGRVSSTAGRDHYCHATITGDGLVVRASKRTDHTDTFTIYRESTPPTP